MTAAPSLARALSTGELWIKRDDLSSNVFGGGKVRKLEWILGDARHRGHEEIITFGGVGSNHCVAVAAFGARHGFKVIVELAPQPKSEVTARQLRACAAFGAEIHAVASVSTSEARALRRKRNDPRAPYVIPKGGTSALGDLGFVEAGLELAAQIQDGAPRPDVIVMAMGTMGSVAGLALGLRLAELDIPIRAVRCSSHAASNPSAFAVRRAETRAFMMERGAKLNEGARVIFEDGFLGDGYGRPTKEGRHAMHLASETTGIAFEPIYTGKALAALRAMDLGARRVLFWASQPPERPLPDPPTSAIPPELRGYL